MTKIYQFFVLIILFGTGLNTVYGQNEGQSCAQAVELDPSNGGCSTLALHSSSWDPAGYGNPEGISPSCWANTDNVLWAVFTPTATATYSITDYCFTGGSKDVGIAVYTGSCGSFTQEACDRSGSSMGCPVSSISMSMNAGTTYYIAYSPQDGDSYTGICLQGGTTPSAPANDNCSNAVALTEDIPVSGTGANATDDGDIGSPPALCSGSIENNVWFEFTATNTQDYYLQVTNANCSQDAGFQVSVYQSTVSCSDATGSCVAFSNSATNDDFQTTVSLVSGETYLINIDGQAGVQCDFDIEMSTVDDLTCTASASMDNGVSCNGGSDGQATATGNSGSIPYSFLWSNGQTQATLTGAIAGTYNVTVTDNDGCPATARVTITEPTAITVSSTSTDVLCNGQSNGSIDITSSGGTTPYTFNWSNGDNLDDISGLAAGSYTLTLTDNNSCTEVESVTISEPTPITITYSQTDVSCNGESDGAIDVSVSGGTNPYTYSWSSGPSSQDISNLAGGTYTVTVFDNATCTVQESITITEPATALAVSITSTGTRCVGSDDGTIDLTASGGGTAYSYTWSNSETTEDITGLVAGTYTATVTDGGCIVTVSETISDPTPISINATVTNATCGSNNGTVSAEASGGLSTSYTYDWSNGATTATITGLGIGNYTVTVTNGLGCTNTRTESVSGSNHTVTVTLVSDVSCNGGSDGAASASASGGITPYTYLWADGTTTNTIGTLSAGVNYVTVTDGSTCEAIGQVSITEPAAIITTTNVTNVLCNGESNGSIDVTVSGGASPYTYSWSTGATTEDISGLPEGTYSIYIVDNNNCDFDGNQLSTSCVEIKEILANACGADEEDNEMIRFQVGPSVVTTSDISIDWPSASWDGYCQTAATATTVANINGTIVGGGQLIEPGATIPPYSQVIVVTSELFDWTAHDWSNLDYDLYILFQCGDQGVAHYKNYDAVDGTPRTTTVNIGACNDVASYIPNELLNGGDGDGALFDDVGTPTYTNNGCAAPISAQVIPVMITITEPVALTISEVSSSDVICNGESNGTVEVVGTGGTTTYNYLWSDGQTTTQAVGLIAGTYSATVTDANSCEESLTITITEPTALTGSITCVSVTTNGGSDGSVSGTASGGTTAYTYTWNVSANTTNSVTGLSAGAVDVTITDANGCSVTDVCTITEPSCNLTLSVATTPVSCFGGTDGEALATTAGGSGYTYAWSTSGNITDTETGLSPGIGYTVTVTDIYNCTTTGSYDISEPQAITVSTTITSEPSCYNSSDGVAQVSVIGGSSPYTYIWSDGQTTDNNAALAGVGYNITVTDVNNCPETDAITLTAPTIMASTVTPLDALCNGEASGEASVAVTGGTSPYSYSWTGGLSTTTGLAANNYTLTITDANNCDHTESFTISEPSAIILSTTTTFADCGGGTNGTATIIASGGQTPYTYLWNNSSQTTQIATGFMAGTHGVTVTDNNSCNNSTNALVSNPSPTITVTASTTITCNAGSDGTATIIASGGVTPYTYQWGSGSNTTGSVTGLSAGLNNITVYDNSNCLAITVVDIDEPNPITVTSNVSDILCFGLTDGAINITPTGGASGYTYNWSTGATTQNISGLMADIYELEVTDANNCVSGSSTSNVINPISGCVKIRSILVDACGAVNEEDDEMFLFQTGSSPLNVNDITITWATGANSWDGVSSNPTWIANTNASIVGGGSVTELGAGDVIPANSMVLFVTSDVLTSSNNDLSTLSEDIYVIFQNSGNTNGHFGNYNSGGGTRTLVLDFGGGCSDAASYERDLLLMQDEITFGAEDGATVNYSDVGGVTYTNPGCVAPISSTTVTPSTVSFSFTVTQPTELAVTLTSNDITCFGISDGEGFSSVSGGTTPYSYLWSNSETTPSTSALSSGVNTITITDLNMCTLTDAVTITEPAQITLTASSTDILCFNDNDGTGTAIPSGGTTPYFYIWSDPSTQQTQIATGLTSGTYTVEVYDNNDCYEITSITISEPVILSLTGTNTNINCYQGTDGSITTSISGGVTPYSYMWQTGETTQNLSGLVVGTYGLTVSDINNCEANYQAVLTEPGDITTTSASVDENCGGADGSASITVTGGADTNYSYAWTNGSVSSTSTGLNTGKQYVTITDGAGCVYLDSVQVGTSGNLTITAITADIQCNGESSGSISLNLLSGITPYSYAWNNSETTATISGLVIGNYFATVTDASGCLGTITEAISEPMAITLTSNNTDVLCNGGTTGTASTLAEGGTTPYNYLWSNGETSSAVSTLAAGNYILTLTDNNGCIQTTNVTVVEPTALTITGTVDANSNCYGESSGMATIVASGGVSAYNYTWSNGGTGMTNSTLNAGTHSITVTDGNNCIEVTTVTITEPAEMFIGNVTTTNASCEGLSDGSVMVTITGGNTPYNYTWSNSSSDSSLTSVPEGIYGVTVTDNLGCSIDSSGIVVNSYEATAEFTWTAESYVVPADVVFTNMSSGADYFVWDFGTGLSSDAENPSYTFEEAGEYEVILTAYVDSNKLCNDTAKHLIIIEEEPSYQIPNVFSPNADGENDIFTINGINIADIEGVIFNRWGTEIFKWETIQGGWDGRTYAGEEASEGTYFYVITVQVLDSDKPLPPFTGTVTLVR